MSAPLTPESELAIRRDAQQLLKSLERAILDSSDIELDSEAIPVGEATESGWDELPLELKP